MKKVDFFDLSILIPARNEMFLTRTVENILDNIEGHTQIIVVSDGCWPDPPVTVHPRVDIIHLDASIGQRAATNMAARMSRAKYIMKCDAHCAFGKGFDRIMMEDMQYDWTMVPIMYNLYGFDWVCPEGHRRYQGRSGPCEECGAPTERDMVWQPKPSPETTSMRFDKELRFKYWSPYKKVQGDDDIVETMSLLGACWLVERERYWEIEMCDEGHGSWGQMGTEVACKTWLSGGRLVVNRKTWFAHLFRTQGGDFGFPYSNPGASKAREYSKDLWLNDKWDKAIYPLSWLIDKFAPIPDWHDDSEEPTGGIVYYTDNDLDDSIFFAVQRQLHKACGEHEIISVSLEKLHRFGRNVVLDLEREPLTMFKQILAGLEKSRADYVFFCEHDILYHPSHFDFIPPEKDKFYYNTNVWKVRLEDGHAVRTDKCQQTSGLCAYRELLLEHYRKRIDMVEEIGYSRKMGFEPGTHGRKERVDDYKSESWESEFPNIDIRHDRNLTPNRWSPDQFRNQRYTEGWVEAEEIPDWGIVKGRFDEILEGV